MNHADTAVFRSWSRVYASILCLGTMASLAMAGADDELTVVYHQKRTTKIFYAVGFDGPGQCENPYEIDDLGDPLTADHDCTVPASRGFSWERRGASSGIWHATATFSGPSSCSTDTVDWGSICLTDQNYEAGGNLAQSNFNDDCEQDDQSVDACADGSGSQWQVDLDILWKRDTSGEYGYVIDDGPAGGCPNRNLFPGGPMFVPAGPGQGAIVSLDNYAYSGSAGWVGTGWESHVTGLSGTRHEEWVLIAPPRVWPCDVDANIGDPRDGTQPKIGEGGLGESGGLQGAFPTDACPVDLASGDKVETAVDLTVTVTGSDFVLTRTYSSDPDFAAPDLSGYGWTMSPCLFLEDIGNDALRLSGMARSAVEIDVSGTGPEWPLPGSTTQVVTKASVTIPGLHVDDPTAQSPQSLEIPVWRVIEPGQWELDFYRVNETGETNYDEWFEVVDDGSHESLPVQRRDVYGNAQTFQYVLYDHDDDPETAPLARLTQVRLNGDPDALRSEADVRFFWDVEVGSANPGRLDEVHVYRFLDEEESANNVIVHQVLTQKVLYRYMDETDQNLSDDLGRTGDLIQVAKLTRVDPDPGTTDPVWRTHVTQYRYHGNPNGSGGTTEYTWAGDEHQLKLIILPEQIEYAVQQRNDEAHLEEAEDLLGLDDDATVYTNGPILVDLAAKIVETYETSGEKRVKKQYLLSACGCGGGDTQGLRREYTYWDRDSNTPGATTIKVEEKQRGTTGFDSYRTYHYEMTTPGTDLPYLATIAITDDTPADVGTWLTHHQYDDDRNRIATHTAASLSGYTPGDNSNAPSLTRESSGLVHVFEYNSDNRLTKRQIKDGDPTFNGSYECQNCILIEETTYPTADQGGERKHLPSKIERIRVTSSPSADEIETTTFSYGFHGSSDDDDNVAWIKTAVEAELESENGPSTAQSPVTYDSFELFDTEGKNIWSRAADGSLTKRVFDIDDAAALSSTGQVVTVIRNADEDVDGLPNNHAGLSTTGWDDRNNQYEQNQYVQNGSSLVTEYVFDLLGRQQEMIEPGSVSTYTRREMRTFDERTGLTYYAEVTLPHELSAGSEYNGPAVITWYNAGEDVIGSSGYSMDAGYTFVTGTQDNYTLVISDYSLDDELTRERIAHDISGLVEKRETWHRVADDASYETAYEYDTLGRVQFETNPEGTVTEYQYDALDRVILVKVGTNTGDPGNREDVVKYIYDGSNDTPGVGNGNITRIREPVDDVQGNDRVTNCVYDFRDRRTQTVNPAAPNEVIVYDNLDRVIERALLADTPSSNDLSGSDSDRKLYVATHYSQRGLVYKQQLAINPTAADGNRTFLETNSWYDEAGRTIELWPPTSPATKATYDGIGRPVVEYVTDRRSDDGPGTSGNYDDVYHTDTGTLTTYRSAKVTGDVILSQTEYRYIDDLGVLDLVTTYRRTHDATDTDTGALSGLASAKSIITYVGTDYDAANRPSREIQFGTRNSDGFVHGGATITKTDGQFNTTNDDLISEIAYEVRGLLEVFEDAETRETKLFYDDLNRRIGIIENSVTSALDLTWDSQAGRWKITGQGASPAPDHEDEDRVTTFVYDGNHNIVKQVAHFPSSDDSEVQITEYVYGVGPSPSEGPASELYSNDLLAQVIYPDVETGEGEKDHSVYYGYNRKGERIGLQDQNGTDHEYVRDKLGRIELDKVTTFGANIDNEIKAIEYVFDAMSRLTRVSSYDNLALGTGDIVNEVRFSYDDLWQVEDVDQDHTSQVTYTGGGVPDGDGQRVKYAYDTQKLGDGNYTRIDTLTYPNSDSISYAYGSSGSSDDVISRVTSIGVHDGIDYSYIGLDMVARVDLGTGTQEEPNIRLDYFIAHSGEETSGEYPGFDRFGRITRQMWVDASFGPQNPPDPDYGTRPPVVEIDYSYDKVSNRLTAYDARPGANRNNRDFEYDYDELHRVFEARRGVQGDPFQYFGDGSNRFTPSQKWELDILGNWKTIFNDNDGDGNYESPSEEESRTHSDANELEQRDLDGTGSDRTFQYDKVGNLRTVDTSSITYTHDGWNRLVQVDYGATNRAKYKYNGLYWRIIREADTNPLDIISPDRVRHMYYSADWQVLEERVDKSPSGSFNTDSIVQYVWGLRYIDDIVLHREDDDAATQDPDYEDIWYHLTDVQYSTVAILDDLGVPAERVTYDAYGYARHHWPADVDGDGDVDSSDLSAIQNPPSDGDAIGEANYIVDADLDHDGDIDSTDYSLATGSGTGIKAALGRGVITSSSVDNLIGYDGYVFNVEDGLYTVRFRCYEPVLGRWLERDPLHYTDGMTLYEAVVGSPLVFVDPLGLEKDYGLFRESGFYLRGAWQTVRGEAFRYWNSVRDLDIRPSELAAGIGFLYSTEVDSIADRALQLQLKYVYGDPADLTTAGIAKEVLYEGTGLNDIAFACVGWDPLTGKVEGVERGQGIAFGISAVAGMAAGGPRAMSQVSRTARAGRAMPDVCPCPNVTSLRARAAVRPAHSNYQYGRKIRNDMAARGWSDSLIDKVITKPHARRAAVNKATGGDATAYFRRDGAYVVRDNTTKRIIQVSKIGDPNWIPDSSIQNPYRPK